MLPNELLITTNHILSDYVKFNVLYTLIILSFFLVQSYFSSIHNLFGHVCCIFKYSFSNALLEWDLNNQLCKTIFQLVIILNFSLIIMKVKFIQKPDPLLTIVTHVTSNGCPP